MKNDVLHPAARVDRFILQNVQEVKETLAPGVSFKKNQPKSFGVPDMWNIRRNARYATERIRK